MTKIISKKDVEKWLDYKKDILEQKAFLACERDDTGKMVDFEEKIEEIDNFLEFLKTILND